MGIEYKKSIEPAERTRADQSRTPYWLPIFLVTFLLAVVSPWSLAARQAEDLDATIQYLIDYVKQSDDAFVRNSSRYTGREAADHIDKKYRHFKNEIDTPEKFIELCASGSLMTGKPYFIITRQGQRLSSSEWLNTELSAYRNRSKHENN